MHKPVLTCALLSCLIVPSANLFSQAQLAPSQPAATSASAPVSSNPQTPEEFFARARQFGDLEASGIPFHLKAAYIASGNTEFTGNGTYEEWWQSKDVWREEASLGDFKYVAIKDGKDENLYATLAYVPLRLQQVLDAILVQIDPDTGTAYKWKLKHTKISGLDLAVLSSKYECGNKFTAVQCPAQDYFTQGGLLRIRTKAAIQFLYNNFRSFQGVLIPYNITVTAEETSILTISIASLDKLNPNDPNLPKDMLPPTNLKSIAVLPNLTDATKSTVQVPKPKLIHGTPPIYPVDAKQHGIEGKVVMNASIDATGRVREPYVIMSAGPLLDKAALDAFRQWLYTPIVINGIPGYADTTITAVFNLR